MFEHVWSEETLGWIIAPQGNLPSPEILKDADLYFVWGNLMNPAFVRGILGHSIPFAPAALKGYRREIFLKDGKREFLLIPSQMDVVMGVVLISPCKEDIIGLDRFEQVPKVNVKRRIEVMIGDLRREANIYMAVGTD
jgi:hypothetical protein